MGLFTKSNSALDGMSEEAKRLAGKLNGGGSSTATLVPPAGAPVTKPAPAASVMTPPPRNIGVTNPPPQTERQLYFQQLKVISIIISVSRLLDHFNSGSIAIILC